MCLNQINLFCLQLSPVFGRISLLIFSERNWPRGSSASSRPYLKGGGGGGGGGGVGSAFSVTIPKAFPPQASIAVPWPAVSPSRASPVRTLHQHCRPCWTRICPAPVSRLHCSPVPWLSLTCRARVRAQQFRQ